jgi:hypothetical protein
VVPRRRRRARTRARARARAHHPQPLPPLSHAFFSAKLRSAINDAQEQQAGLQRALREMQAAAAAAPLPMD